MPDLEATLSAYVAAWNTPHAAVRRRHLDRACAPAIAYDDPWGRLEGVDSLAAHIDHVRRVSPGAHWEPQGPVLRSRDRLLLRWVWARGAQPQADGHTLMRLDGGHRIASAVVRVRGGLAAWNPLPLQVLCAMCGTTE